MCGNKIVKRVMEMKRLYLSRSEPKILCQNIKYGDKKYYLDVIMFHSIKFIFRFSE